ncbi:hypothetical protein CAPTEDRAFT_207938, partial [Capitella teleta]
IMSAMFVALTVVLLAIVPRCGSSKNTQQLYNLLQFAMTKIENDVEHQAASDLIDFDLPSQGQQKVEGLDIEADKRVPTQANTRAVPLRICRPICNHCGQMVSMRYSALCMTNCGDMTSDSWKHCFSTWCSHMGISWNAGLRQIK